MQPTKTEMTPISCPKCKFNGTIPVNYIIKDGFVNQWVRNEPIICPLCKYEIER